MREISAGVDMDVLCPVLEDVFFGNHGIVEEASSLLEFYCILNFEEVGMPPLLVG